MRHRYVVTGDRGFVGSHLRRHLLAAGHEVIGIGRSDAPAEPGGGRYTALAFDLADRREVEIHAGALRSARAVFHLAARLPQRGDDPLEAHLAANRRATENLLEVLAGRRVPLVFSSTMSVFGLPPERLPVDEGQLPRPDGPYGLTKLAAERAVEDYARSGWVSAVVLRYPGIFGAGYDYGAIHLYTERALAGETVSVFGGGRIVRDYVHVDDVVAANLLVADKLRPAARAKRASFRLYHIGGGEPLPLLRVAQHVIEAAGRGRLETNEQPGPPDFAFDISRARAELGYAPQPLKDRIAQYVAALQQARQRERMPS